MTLQTQLPAAPSTGRCYLAGWVKCTGLHRGGGEREEYWCMLLGWSWAGTVPALVTGDGSGQRPKKLYYIQTNTTLLTTHSCLRS